LAGLYRLLTQAFPDSPDVGPKLAIGHLNPVELERLPDLLHFPATVQAGLDLGPSPQDPAALGPRCRGRKGAEVREVGSGFSRIAAAVHEGYSTPISQGVQRFVNRLSTIHELRHFATVCQQSVNDPPEQPTVGVAKTPVVEHKGNAIRPLRFFGCCFLF
jgi:hypothetical protein